MTFTDGLILFFAIMIIYYLLVFILHKKGILEKLSVSLYGPFLMFKTTKGINFLKKLSSKKRFWKAYGSFGIVFCLIVMITIVIIFIWNFIMLLGLSPAQRALIPGPEFALVLPGINPILPMEYFVYIIIAFVVAIIVHEFSHGILTIVGDLKVKSMGILYLIIPVGAFVEPDEEQMKKTKISKRMRVYAVGPLSNFVVFFICFMLFSFVFMASVQPASDGVVVVSISNDSPAYNNSFEKGMVIISINNSTINTYEDFFIIMDNTISGEEVEIEYYWNGIKSKTLVFSDKYGEYEKRWPSLNNESFKGKGYFGVGPYPQDFMLPVLQNPFGYNSHIRILYWIGLPISGYFEGYNPISYPFTESYKIVGPLSFIPKPIFWGIVNILYWVAWLNLMVGLFNMLPMIPLDGGFLFNDYIRSAVLTVKKEISVEKLDKAVKNISLVISLIILFLIIAPFIFKYI